MLRSYLKIAVAVFRRRPFFTFVNLFGITFTLTALLVVAALFDHVFAGSPPEVHADRTLGIFRTSLIDDEHPNALATALASRDLLERYMRGLPGAENESISSVFWKSASYVDGHRVDSFLKYTDAQFWEILTFDMLEGRPFTRDEVADAAYVAVINRASRERFFGGQPAVGRSVDVDGTRYRVVGVVDNVPMLRLVPFADIWVPLTTAPNYRQQDPVIGLYMGLILAESRARFADIKAEFAARMATVDLSSHEGWDRVVAVPETTFASLARIVFSMGRDATTQTGRLMVWLMVLAVLFMVLPTVNMVNLNVSRIMERASEIGVRKAFGASVWTLVGQFVVENVLLTLVGGVLAVGVTSAVLALIAGAGWIPYAEFHLNLRILAWALAATLFFGLFSGVYPAWRMSRMHPVDALQGGRS